MTLPVGSIAIKYSATGEKLQKTTNSSKGVTNVVDYCGNIEYENEELAAIHHSTGRIIPAKGGGFRYQFQLTDHLGNVRILFEDKDQSGNITKPNPEGGIKNPFIIDEEEIIVINHYYPFGLQMTGAVNPWYDDSNGRKYDYSYNGKELNDDFGLDWSDYGARWYDATIGRWGAVDPLAEKYASISPYVYVANNPIIFTDPDGRKIKYGKDDNTKKDKRRIKKQIRQLRRNSKTFNSMYKKLKKDKNHTHTIHSVKGGSNVLRLGGPSKNGNSSNINIDLSDNTVNGIPVPNSVVMGHEFAHAERNNDGSPRIFSNDPSRSFTEQINDSKVENAKIHAEEEVAASHVENMIRAELDPTGKVIPLREEYRNLEKWIPSVEFENGKVIRTLKLIQYNENVIKPGFDYYNN